MDPGDLLQNGVQSLCVNARTKSRATLKTYRVVHATWNQVVTVVQGSAEPH